MVAPPSTLLYLLSPDSSPPRLEGVHELVLRALAVLQVDRDRCPGSKRLLADLPLDLVADLGILAEEVLGVLPPLADPRLAEGEEGARLADDRQLDAQVEQA